MRRLILGVDLGSTSTKVALVDSDSGQLVQAETEIHNADRLGLPSGWHEQDAGQILGSFVCCLKRLPPDSLSCVVGVGFAGQQHGVVCWSDALIDRLSQQNGFEQLLAMIDADAREYWSDLVTWQDQRADGEFLQRLPPSSCPIHSGYGFVSLLWIQQNGAGKDLRLYNYAGNIMDFLVAIVCCLRRSLISFQNAERWGFYSIHNNRWDSTTLMVQGIPEKFIPEPTAPGTVVGSTAYPLLSLPAGVKVFVALGDLQSSIFVALQKPVAVLNMGTSSQLLFEVKRSELASLSLPSTVSVVPHLVGTYLVMAASLNGGNILKAFVQRIAQFFNRVTGTEIDEKCIWSRLLTSQTDEVRSLASQLKVESTLFGERHNTELKASLSGLDLDHLDVEVMFGALIRGLFVNLFQMLPAPLLIANGKTTVVATGQAAAHPYVQYLKDVLPVGIGLECGSTDAANGAALIARKYLSQLNTST